VLNLTEGVGVSTPRTLLYEVSARILQAVQSFLVRTVADTLVKYRLPGYTVYFTGGELNIVKTCSPQ
jgi:hypothetical protein